MSELDPQAVPLHEMKRLEAEIAILRAEVRAWRHNDACYRWCEYGLGNECTEQDWTDASSAVEDARATTDAHDARRKGE